MDLKTSNRHTVLISPYSNLFSLSIRSFVVFACSKETKRRGYYITYTGRERVWRWFVGNPDAREDAGCWFSGWGGKDCLPAWCLAVSDGVWDAPFPWLRQLSSVSRREKASPRGPLVATRTRFLGESSGLKMGRSSAWKPVRKVGLLRREMKQTRTHFLPDL